MVGKVLKELRLGRGYTLVQLEKKSGVSYVQITRYENNKSMPTGKTLKKLADALEVTVGDITEKNQEEVLIKDEDLEEKFKKVKNIVPENSASRLALSRIFELMILEGNINEIMPKKVWMAILNCPLPFFSTHYGISKLVLWF